MRSRLYVNISHEHKVIFYLVPRAASTSIRHALGLGDQPSNAHRREIERLPEPYLSFAVVRNPWDRLVSVWAYAREKYGVKPAVTGRMTVDMKLPRRCSFKKFAARACEIGDDKCNMHYRSQHRFIPNSVDRVLRFEMLGDDWQRLQEERPSLPDLEWHETSAHEYYLTHYDQELLNVVGHRYRGDIKRFGCWVPDLDP